MKTGENISKILFKSDTISVAVGVASAFSGILGMVTKFFESSIGISIIVIGIFFLVQYLASYIINKKKESFGVQTHYYSLRRVKIAKVTRKLSYAFWLVPMLVIINTAFAVRGCINNDKLGVVISNFAAAEDDDFSYKLFHVLSASIGESDTIGLMRDERHVNVGKENYMAQLKSGLSDHCFKKGLFVFGKRNSSSQMFDCNIYVDNMPAILQKHLASSKNGILYLQNPAVMNFSIDNEAQAVSKFITGLLLYNAQDYERVNEEINEALQKQDTLRNRFKSYCRLYLGNSMLMRGKATEAVKVFREGIEKDESDPYLHYNLATTYLYMDDSVKAKHEYAEAARLNAGFTNPLKDVEFADAADTAMIVTAIPTAKQNLIVESNPEPEEEEEKELYSSEYTIIVFREKYGVVNQAGDTIVPMEYDNIDPTPFIIGNQKYFLVEMNQKYGALKENGKEEIPVVHGSKEYVKSILKIQSTILNQKDKVNF